MTEIPYRERVRAFHQANKAEREPEPNPTCPHGCGPLRWVDTAWYCPKCGDEWPEEVGS